MLVGFPFFGILFAGYPVRRYLEFPPETKYVHHAAFSVPVFILYTVFILFCIFPFFIRFLKCVQQSEKTDLNSSFFPWWGKIGLVTGFVTWLFAWTRFSWFAPFQPHTFTLLWISFILITNGWCFKRTGHCMIIDRPKYFFLLFPASSVFWWFFEYLNRFVQNWSYTGVHYNAGEYFLYATISFSTVLPAVLGTRELLESTLWIKRFKKFCQVKISRSKILSWAILTVSAAGLFLIGIKPDIFFPLIWVSPLLIIVSLQTLMGEKHIFSNLSHGNWIPVISCATAALFCGLFWEMWNFYSLAKWEYAVPFVNRFKIFEMPLLGYAGYLPFGMECAVIGDMLKDIIKITKFDIEKPQSYYISMT